MRVSLSSAQIAKWEHIYQWLLDNVGEQHRGWHIDVEDRSRIKFFLIFEKEQDQLMFTLRWL